MAGSYIINDVDMPQPTVMVVPWSLGLRDVREPPVVVMEVGNDG